MENIKTTSIKNLNNDNYFSIITDILENYKQNPNDLIQLTKFSSNFTKYSINNNILLHKQNSGATFVATYNQWQNLGYKVIEKGSGIKLLHPNTRLYFYHKEENKYKLVQYATLAEQEKIKNKEYDVVRKITSYSTFIVHDISATNCPVEEYPNFYNMGYSSELHKNIADALIDYCSENKILISQENLNSISLRGLAYTKQNIIKLNSLMKDTEKLSTLVHQIGHITMHRDIKGENSSKSTALKDFEADLLSIMFYSNYNLEISNSTKYHFKDNFNKIDKDKFDLLKTLNDVHREYKKLSNNFDKYIEKQLSINDISLDNRLENNRLNKIKEILDSGNYIKKSVIEAKAGEFCIGENKNPLQIIEKNNNEYKAIDLITKRDIISSFQNKLESKDIYTISTVPILKKGMQNDKNIVSDRQIQTTQNVQGYKIYNLEAIKEIPIKTILDDLGYKRARNGMYNIRGEKTASVKVYENTNSYYDFGCASGGNVINLIKETQNMDIKDSINFLGERYSVPYEQIGIQTQEKSFYLSSKDWADLGIDFKIASKNYIPNPKLTSKEHTNIIRKLSKINMNDLINKEPSIFKDIIQHNVIPLYINKRNRYLYNMYISCNSQQLFKGDISLIRDIHNDLSKQDFLILQKNYENLEKIKQFIPDLKIDKLSVNYEKDKQNINNKSIEIGYFSHSDMKQLQGIKNYLTIPYKNFKEFENQATTFPYSAFLKGDKVTITILNKDKTQAQNTINHVKQIDVQKQKTNIQNISL